MLLKSGAVPLLGILGKEEEVRVDLNANYVRAIRVHRLES